MRIALIVEGALQRLFQTARSLLVVAAGLVLPCADVLAQSGGNWNSVGPPGGTVLSILKSPLSESLLYAGTSQNGVFMSGNGGQTWSAANVGLAPTAGSASRTVRALVSDGQYVYAATEAGIFFAVVGAAASDLPSWSQLITVAGMPTISHLAFEPSTGSLFAAASIVSTGAVPVVYRMSVPAPGAAPAGNWVASPLPADTTDAAIGALAVVPASGANSAGLLVGAANRTFVASVVLGAAALNWIDADPFRTFFATGAIEALHFSADFSQTYACSAGQLFVASDPLNPPQNPWLPASVSPAPAAAFTCAAIASGGLAGGAAPVVAVATSAGVYVSFNGTSFGPTSALSVSPAANAMVIAGIGAPALYVGAGFGVASQALATLASNTAWAANNGPATVSAGGSNGRLNNADVTDSAVIGTSLFAAVASGQYAGVLRSTDTGATWVSTGLSAVTGNLVEIAALAADPANGIVYAGTSNGLYALSTTAGTWVAVSSANIPGVVALSRGTAGLYIGTDAGIFALPLGATPSSATAVAAGLAGLRVSAVHVADGKVYAGTFDFNTSLASVSVATDVSSGTPAWSDFATGAVGPNRIFSLALAGTSLLAGTRGGLVRVAAPGGAWTSANTSASSTDWVSDPNGVVTSLFSDGTTVFAATGSNGIFASPVGAGFTWMPFNGIAGQDLPAFEVHQLRANGTMLYAATSAGIAAFDGIVGVGPSTPGPAPAPESGGGGGGAEGWPLLGLALLVGLLAALSRARRRRT